MDSTEKILRQVLIQLETIEKQLPKDRQISEELVKQLEERVSRIEKLINDPYQGIIVNTNKNTEFRRTAESTLDSQLKDLEGLRRLIDWKKDVNKALWILFTATIGLAIKLIFF